MTHEKRKKIRKLLAVLYGLIIGLSLLGIYIFTELSAGFLNVNTVKRAVSGENYCGKTEERFREQVTELLASYGIPGYVSEKIAEDADIYNRAFLDLKHKYAGDGTEADFRPVYSNAGEYLEPYVKCGVLTEEEYNTVMEKLGSFAEEAVAAELPMESSALLRRLSAVKRPAVLLSAVIFLLAFGSMYYMYEYRHRAIRVLVRGTVFAAAGSLLFTGVLVFYFKKRPLTASTELWEKVLGSYLRSSLSVFGIGMAAAVLAVLISWCWYRYEREQA